MTTSLPKSSSYKISERARTFGAAGIIVLGALAAYRGCFHAPLLLDDASAIVENLSIRRLWPDWNELWTQTAHTTVNGRPLANLTLAINYALSGTDVGSYHALNLLIHVLSGLTLLGIVRRTMLRPVLRERFGWDALPLALAVALLWTLHPLQTEAVTYVIQRVESLMGLCYLLTFYCLIRSVDSPRPSLWQGCMVTVCLLGMATKEVMATAPLLALLYDRTFLAGSFREAWQRRRWWYVGLAATWLPLACLVAGTGGNRGGTSGFDVGVAPWAYWLTQFQAVAHYLKLSVWPHPLVFEYGTFWVRPVEALPYAVIVVPLAVATVIALWRRPVLGFLGAWFFMILAPSSIVPVATQTMAEHRMYLPLAAVIVAAVVGIYTLAGRRSWILFGTLAIALGMVTGSRNENYQSELAIWSDTVAKWPTNARAQTSLGLALDQSGRTREAIQHFEATLRIKPDDADAHNNLGNILDRSGRTSEAIRHYAAALRARPHDAQTLYNLGLALDHVGRISEAIERHEAALRIKPDFAEARNNLGVILWRSGRVREAIQQYEGALRIKPDYARAHYNLGNALAQAGMTSEAIRHYEEALRIEPDLAEAGNNLGVILCQSGRIPDGILRIEEALRTKPDFIEAHFALGTALLATGRVDEAITEYEKVLQLRPNDPLRLSHANPVSA